MPSFGSARWRRTTKGSVVGERGIGRDEECRKRLYNNMIFHRDRNWVPVLCSSLWNISHQKKSLDSRPTFRGFGAGSIFKRAQVAADKSCGTGVWHRSSLWFFRLSVSSSRVGGSLPIERLISEEFGGRLIEKDFSLSTGRLAADELSSRQSGWERRTLAFQQVG